MSADEAPRSKEKRRTKAERRAAEELAESTLRSKSASGNGKDRFEDAQEAREVASARDVSLSIFHAIGKILHNKRTDRALCECVCVCVCVCVWVGGCLLCV